MNIANPADNFSGTDTASGWENNGLSHVIPKNRTSFVYRAALALVALTMLMLPVVYAALTGLAGYGVHYYATHGLHAVLAWDTGGSGRLGLLKFLCAVTPIIVGSLVVVFMVKPLFAGPVEGMHAIRLIPQAEPRLFGFIEKLCGVIGAPMPQRVEIDCELNASASFRRGLGSFLGNDLVLTIGLPLVAGLSAREFAGVLAHEFGHFTQGAGMRLTYLIRRVNFWLVRSIYERDAWDDFLDTFLFTGNKALTILAVCAHLGIWLSRLVLRGLLLFGNFVSGLLLRQMEYDADSYEIKIAGSATFETTTNKLHTLGEVVSENTAGLQGARMMDYHFHLPDDFPELVARCEEQLPAHARERILERAAKEKTGLLATHPSSRDRVRRAREANDAGIFSTDERAQDLFANYDAHCKCVTLAHYRSDWKVPASEDALVPVPDFLASRAAVVPIRLRPEFASR